MVTNRKERKESAGPLTVNALAGMRPGEWETGSGPKGAGRLQARCLPSGEVRLYYRFTGPDGTRERVALGTWCRDGIRGLTLADAYIKARELAERVRSGERDLRAALAAEELRHRRELDAEAARKRAAEEAEAAGRDRTLGVLLTAYTASLEARGAVRVKEVAGCLRLHVEQAFPALWARAADSLDAEDLLEPVARLVQAGKKREAGKLRSYLRAAYAAAVSSRTDPAAPSELRALKIRSNPAAALATVKGSIKARNRALTAPELVAYFRRVQELPDPHRALLASHLLLGAQRVEQLARLILPDWNTADGVVTLADGKGRREQARPHPVPVLPIVAKAFNVMRRGAGPAELHLWSLTGGRHGCTYQAAADAVERVAVEMLEAGEVSARFTLGDLRRSVESVLAGLGVPLEVRAYLQSHGLTGVQQRFYVRHDFHAEKLEALRALWSLVDPAGEQADRQERERLAALAAPNVRQFRRA
jgi:hypothetical protein